VPLPTSPQQQQSPAPIPTVTPFSWQPLPSPLAAYSIALCPTPSPILRRSRLCARFPCSWWCRTHRQLAEFIIFARENRGKVTYASPGVGTTPHLAGELLKRIAGIEMTHVPYRGDALALIDTIAGRVDLQIGGSAMLEQIRGHAIRGLAVTTAKRSPLAPELPSAAEAGIPGFDVMAWFAFVVPVKTPPAIVEKIHVDTVSTLNDPGTKAKFQDIGMVAAGSTPDELAALFKAEMEKWTTVIRDAKISLD
jgi:tripartite-type tricarboxylate transporter receptor subunit TctC